MRKICSFLVISLLFACGEPPKESVECVNDGDEGIGLFFIHIGEKQAMWDEENDYCVGDTVNYVQDRKMIRIVTVEDEMTGKYRDVPKQRGPITKITVVSNRYR